MEELSHSLNENILNKIHYCIKLNLSIELFSGETPETLIDPSLGNRLSTLRNALASILSVTIDSIVILAIRPVFQYRSPYFPPLPFDVAKQQALTDVIFYVPSRSRNNIETTLNTNLAQFSSNYGITANASGPNPCTNYVCPTGIIVKFVLFNHCFVFIFPRYYLSTYTYHSTITILNRHKSNIICWYQHS